MGTPTSTHTGGGIVAARSRTAGTVILLTAFHMEVPALASRARLLRTKR